MIRNFISSQRLNLLAPCVGLTSAGIGLGLLALIHWITNLSFHGVFSFSDRPGDFSTFGAFAILTPAAGGLVIGLIARYGSPEIRGHGIPEAMHGVVMNQSRIPLRVAILKPLSTAISIGTGGPFGAEGPVIATGGAIGSLFGQWLPASAVERKTLLAAGAAAGMTAVFGTPMAGLLLSIELLLFEFRARSLLPVALAVGAAMAFRGTTEETLPMLPLTIPVIPGPVLSFGAVLIGMASGAFAVGMTHALHGIEHWFEKLPIPWMWHPMVGGLAVGLLAWIDPRVFGAGYFNLRALLDGNMALNALVILLVLKFLAWSLCLGSGTAGGTLAPVMTMGGAVGSLVALGLHLVPGFESLPVGVGALIGMASVFAGASWALLTSVAFAVEATHSGASFGPLLLGCAAAVGVSRLLMKESIMTEKLSRNGVKVPSDYIPDFLATHPVSAAMIENPISLRADMRVADLVEKVSREEAPWNKVRLFPIVNAEGHFVGVISRADILAAVDRDPETTVLEAGTSHAHIIHPDETLADAAERMVLHGVGRLPVVSRAHPALLRGIIGRREILHARGHRMHEETRRPS